MPIPSNWMIKISQLSLLESLGRHRNLRRAAEAIQMQQPAASRLLKSLEDTLGVSLFVRSKNGMEPTSVGEFLIARAEASLGNLKTLPREISDFSEGWRGLIRIGIVPAVLPEMFVQAVRSLSERTPQLHFSIQQANHTHLVNELKHGEIDVAISRAAAGSGAPELKSSLRYFEEYVLVSSHTGGVTDIEEILDQMWILPPEGVPLRRDIDLYMLNRFGRSPRHVIEVVALDVVGALLQSMPALATVPQSFVQMRSKGLNITPVVLPDIKFTVPVFLLTGPTANLRPWIANFVHHLEGKLERKA